MCEACQETKLAGILSFNKAGLVLVLKMCEACQEAKLADILSYSRVVLGLSSDVC